jgi:hypothetical protein
MARLCVHKYLTKNARYGGAMFTFYSIKNLLKNKVTVPQLPQYIYKILYYKNCAQCLGELA